MPQQLGEQEKCLDRQTADRNRSPFCGCFEGVADNFFCFDHRIFFDCKGGSFLLCPFKERRVHRAGAEQADGHTAMLVAQLLSDGERKTHHIVFFFFLAGEQRTGEKSGAGCHVEDSAAATLLEVPEKQLG